LIADDSSAHRSLIAMTLRALGYHEITEAEDGQMTLELIGQREFDLLILDIEMPRIDGYAVLTAIKKDPKRCHLPILVASGFDQLEAIVRCIELGAEDFLPKPINS